LLAGFFLACLVFEFSLKPTFMFIVWAVLVKSSYCHIRYPDTGEIVTLEEMDFSDVFLSREDRADTIAALVVTGSPLRGTADDA